MFRHVALAAAVAVALSMVTPHIKAAQRVQARISVAVWCEKSTDGVDSHEEDEVYFLVTGRDSDGSVINRRVNSPAADIECHNRGDRRLLRDVVLYDKSLDPGQAAEITVMAMDEDGGVPPEVATALQASAEQTKKDDSVIGTILQIGAQIAGCYQGTTTTSSAL
jgi:hypothetical protein